MFFFPHFSLILLVSLLLIDNSVVTASRYDRVVGIGCFGLYAGFFCFSFSCFLQLLSVYPSTDPVIRRSDHPPNTPCAHSNLPSYGLITTTPTTACLVSVWGHCGTRRICTFSFLVVPLPAAVSLTTEIPTHARTHTMREFLSLFFPIRFFSSLRGPGEGLLARQGWIRERIQIYLFSTATGGRDAP